MFVLFDQTERLALEGKCLIHKKGGLFKWQYIYLTLNCSLQLHNIMTVLALQLQSVIFTGENFAFCVSVEFTFFFLLC